MDEKKFEILEQKMCKELELLEEKYRTSPNEMSVQDVDRIDKLYHALKSKATYDAMKEAKMGYSQDSYGMSEQRNRDSMGRYSGRMSYGPERDRMYSGTSYGYYPPYPPMPERW